MGQKGRSTGVWRLSTGYQEATPHLTFESQVFLSSRCLLSLLLIAVLAPLPAQAREESATARYIRSVAGTKAAERYTAFIEASAKRWKLDPLLVARVIRLESEFNPREVSHVGAIGLMQVMPFHFARRGIPAKKRMDPATNIDLGCRLLAWYTKRMELTYPGLGPEALLHRALVAYNMGPKGVSRGVYRSRYSEIILSKYLKGSPRDTSGTQPEAALPVPSASASLEPQMATIPDLAAPLPPAQALGFQVP